MNPVHWSGPEVKETGSCNHRYKSQNTLIIHTMLWDLKTISALHYNTCSKTNGVFYWKFLRFF